jgi:hypothetical protein
VCAYTFTTSSSRVYKITIQKTTVMKKLLFTLFACVTFFASQAQDILVKRNGDELEVKVLEINLDEIRYKRFDNLEGPIISIAKNDVFMIKYENGTKVTITDLVRPATQQATYPPRTGFPQENLKLAGPRIGFTILSQK